MHQNSPRDEFNEPVCPYMPRHRILSSVMIRKTFSYIVGKVIQSTIDKSMDIEGDQNSGPPILV